MAELFDPQKLVDIAENQQKVYDAGYAKGKAAARDALIQFTLALVTRIAEEGMTWAEWCDSIYNTFNADCDDSGVYDVHGEAIYEISEGGSRINQMSHDTIYADHIYSV